MKAEEVRAIRDQVGGTKAMAELLEVSERAVRYMCQFGVKRRNTVSRIKRLAEVVSSHSVTL